MAFFSTLRSKSVLPSLGKYYYDDPKNKVNGEFDVVTLDKFGYIILRSQI